MKILRILKSKISDFFSSKISFDDVNKMESICLYAGDVPQNGMYSKFVGLSLFQSNAQHIKHDVTQKYPIPSNSVDIYQSEDVFEHIELENLPSIIDEIYRVLKKGGRFYNFEHNPINPITRKLVNECELDKYAVLLQPSYTKKVTNKNGLKTTNLNYTLFFPRHKFFKIFLGLEKMLSWCPIGAQYYIRAIK